MNRFRLATRLAALPLLLLLLFGDFLSPSDPEVQDLAQFYAPPTHIHFIDAQGKFHWRPFVHRSELVDFLDARYQERMDQSFELTFFRPGYPYRLFGILPASRHLIGVAAPGKFDPLGTDALGRDVLARTLAGAHSSILVLLFGVVAYFVLGVVIGACAGIARGWTDILLMRFSEFVLALPALYLVLTVRVLLPVDVPFWQTVLWTAVTIAAIAWPPLARGVRGLILQVRHAPYVEAAQILGASPWYILSRHLLPVLIPYALAQTAAAAPLFILGEVVLSFLNVGFHGANASWGSMLRSLTQDPRIVTDFWWNLSPLVLVFTTLLCLSSFGTQARRRNPTQLT
jgi:peptide/nickel transport system permease protein